MATKHHLNRNKVYIFPTRWGFLYAAVLIALLLLAINYQISLAYYLAFLLTALGLVTILHTWLNLMGITITSPIAQPVFAGDTAQLKVSITNPKGNTRYAITVSTTKQAVDFYDIAQQASITLPFVAETRGWQPIPRLTIFTEYPLGLLRAWGFARHDSTLLVYPKPSKQHHIPPAMQAGDSDDATPHATMQKGDDEFHGHRTYQQGDPIKHIDWKASSKREHMLLKEYASHMPEVVWYDWAQVDAQDIEQRISLLTRAVIDAHTDNKTYGLILPKQTLKADNTLAHYHACLKALALL